MTQQLSFTSHDVLHSTNYILFVQLVTEAVGISDLYCWTAFASGFPSTFPSIVGKDLSWLCVPYYKHFGGDE